MRTLPLIDTPHRTPLSDGIRTPVNPGCRRCALGGAGVTTCMQAELVDGKSTARGRLLVVGEAPTADEDRAGRPMTNSTGRAVRRVIEKYWESSYVLDYTARCTLGVKGPKYLPDAQVACAPYLRDVFAEAEPDRILVLGGQAARGVLGRYVPPLDTRRNYSWVRAPSGRFVPVLVLMAVRDALMNRHLERMLEQDFAWALGPLDNLLPPLDDGAVFHIVETEDDAQLAAERLREHDWMSWDLETAGRAYSKFFAVQSVSCSPPVGDTAYVWDRRALANPRMRAVLLDLLIDESVGKVGVNQKYDGLAVRAAYNAIVQGYVLDAQLVRHIALPSALVRLEIMSELIGMGGYKQAFEKHLDVARTMIRRARARDVKSKGKQLALLDEDPVITAAVEMQHEDEDAFSYGLVKSPALERYNAADTIATARLASSEHGFGYLRAHPNAKHIWKDLVSHTTASVEQIEAWGIHVNRAGIANFQAYMRGELEKVKRRLDRYNINFKSSPQVAELLYDRLHLHNPLKEGSRSTNKDVLRAMEGQHPIVADMREHRRISTLLSNYGNLDLHIREDGRIHPSLKISGTRTGRMACVDPALHQIPRSEDAEGHTDGRLIKDCFGVPPGYRLVAIDQSQLELRCAAALSGDRAMTEQFCAGTDFHMQTAKLIAPTMWHISPEQVTSAHRSATKSFVFGLTYGMGDPTIAHRLKCSIQEAARLRAAVMGSWPELAQWINNQLAFARRHGYVMTPWRGQTGRIRDLHEIGNRSDDPAARKAQRTAENGSFNTPCQALASDLVLHALCARIVPWIRRSCIDARVVMTVHDSVLFEVREDLVEEVLGVVRPMMTDYELNGVPLKADVEIGYTWGSLQKYPFSKAA